MYAKANDPLALFRELGRLGSVTCQCDISNLPFLDTLDPEDSYLSWDLTLETESDRAAVKEVFDFVDGDCDLLIEAEDVPQESARCGGRTRHCRHHEEGARGGAQHRGEPGGCGSPGASRSRRPRSAQGQGRGAADDPRRP